MVAGVDAWEGPRITRRCPLPSPRYSNRRDRSICRAYLTVNLQPKVSDANTYTRGIVNTNEDSKSHARPLYCHVTHHRVAAVLCATETTHNGVMDGAWKLGVERSVLETDTAVGPVALSSLLVWWYRKNRQPVPPAAGWLAAGWPSMKGMQERECLCC